MDHYVNSWVQRRFEAMIEFERIENVAKTIGLSTNAETVILFGSYARGEANGESDVDLLVVMESDLPRYKRSRELYKLFKPYPFGMDLIVYTPEEIEKGKKSPLSFLSTVLKEGKTLYARN